MKVCFHCKHFSRVLASHTCLLPEAKLTDRVLGYAIRPNCEDFRSDGEIETDAGIPPCGKGGIYWEAKEA